MVITNMIFYCFSVKTVESTYLASDSSRALLAGIPHKVTSDVLDDAIIEEITLLARESAESDRTIARRGTLVRYPQAEATVVICHGFMCNQYDVAFLRRLFPRGKCNVLIFDFRAHGENCADQCCTFGRDEKFDIMAASQYVRNHAELQGLPCIGYGFSMGAASLIEAQGYDNRLFDALILDCPFDSSENIIKKGLEGLKVSALGYQVDMPGRSLLQQYAFHPHVQSFVKAVLRSVSQLDPRSISVNLHPVYPVQSAKKISVPCFMIHCKNDEKISVDAAHAIYNNLASPYKTLWITNGRHHFDSYFYAPEKYTQEIRKFLTSILDGKSVCKEHAHIMYDK